MYYRKLESDKTAKAEHNKIMAERAAGRAKKKQERKKG